MFKHTLKTLWTPLKYVWPFSKIMHEKVTWGNACKMGKRQPHKMVKHTQTIRRLLVTNFLSVFDHFVGSALEGLSSQLVSGFFDHVLFVLDCHIPCNNCFIILGFVRHLSLHWVPCVQFGKVDHKQKENVIGIGRRRRH